MMPCDMSVPCPVCNHIMDQTGNPKIHYCPTRKINFPTFNTDLEMSHATVYLNDSGEQIYLKIISAEYCFEIHGADEDLSSPKTVIKKLQRTHKSNGDHSIETQLEFMEILTIGATIHLPWNNHSKIKEAIQTYLIFS